MTGIVMYFNLTILRRSLEYTHYWEPHESVSL
jgi:hypothetical protein